MSGTNPDLSLVPVAAIARDPSPTRPASHWLHATIFNGSMTLLVGSGLVSAINLIYNIVLARALGASGFGQAVSVYTLLMLLSAVTLSFQFVCSKFVAKNNSLATKAAVYSVLHGRSWQAGAVVGTTLAITSPAISRYLNLSDPTLIVILAVGTAFYIPLGVRRGMLQGMYNFRRLSINFILEVVVKLGGTVALLALGFGVRGVIAAVSASVVAGYLWAQPGPELKVTPQLGLPASFVEGVQAIVFFVGQVVINNVDILLVKHFYPPAEAGLYAAVAVVGRVVYMAAWAVVSSMFPVSAGVDRPEPYRRAVVITPLLLVLLIVTLSLFGLWLLPSVVWRGLFGAGFQLSAQNGYSSLPLLYVATTGVYCLSVVLIIYEMSRKIGSAAWLQLVFSGAIAVGIYWLHGNLHQVIMVQLVLMLLLLVCVFVPFLRLESRPSSESTAEQKTAPVLKQRPLGEDEVIAEFLRNEFYHPEFHRYWQRLEKIVLAPDFLDADHNALRRALLFRRRGRMWRELPVDTRWWEVELGPADLARVRVLPRSHWRKIANGNFALVEVAENIRARAADGLNVNFLAKIRSLSSHLRQEEGPATAILLIGIDENSPLTIIEGNHRMVAAMLLSPGTVCQRFRFFCGFSPRMANCCWYKTDISTLWRYAKNSVRYSRRDSDAKLEDMLSRTRPCELHE
ncbi:MAG: lipopolysaccharide biosynthesis protein [Terriglobales bacterium]